MSCYSKGKNNDFEIKQNTTQAQAISNEDWFENDVISKRSTIKAFNKKKKRETFKLKLIIKVMSHES